MSCGLVNEVVDPATECSEVDVEYGCAMGASRIWNDNDGVYYDGDPTTGNKGYYEFYAKADMDLVRASCCKSCVESKFDDFLTIGPDIISNCPAGLIVPRDQVVVEMACMEGDIVFMGSSANEAVCSSSGSGSGNV